MAKLTATRLASLKEPGRYSDGNNLYLQISKRGGKSWAFIYRWQGKQAKADEARAELASLNSEAAELRQQFVTQSARERTEAEGLTATRSKKPMRKSASRR